MIMNKEQELSAFYLIGSLTVNALIVGFLLMSGCMTSAHAELTPDGYDVEKLADAIFWSEGENIDKPYGIMLPGCQANLPKTCRKYAINTIRNNIVRYNRLSPSDQLFLVFLWHRYCPPSEHPSNVHWLNNVKWFLDHPKEVPHV